MGPGCYSNHLKKRIKQGLFSKESRRLLIKERNKEENLKNGFIQNYEGNGRETSFRNKKKKEKSYRGDSSSKVGPGKKIMKLYYVYLKIILEIKYDKIFS